MKKKILIVDDNPDLRYSVIEGMKAISDISFGEAEDGKKALSMLKKDDYDAVLLDIMMPEMDGWEVAAKMKSDPKIKNVPIIFLTAKTDDFSKGMGKITAEDYIEKPFEINDLKKRIDKIFR